jgi:hypothetical protein
VSEKFAPYCAHPNGDNEKLKGLPTAKLFASNAWKVMVWKFDELLAHPTFVRFVEFTETPIT